MSKSGTKPREEPRVVWWQKIAEDFLAVAKEDRAAWLLPAITVLAFFGWLLS